MKQDTESAGRSAVASHGIGGGHKRARWKWKRRRLANAYDKSERMSIIINHNTANYHSSLNDGKTVGCVSTGNKGACFGGSGVGCGGRVHVMVLNLTKDNNAGIVRSGRRCGPLVYHWNMWEHNKDMRQYMGKWSRPCSRGNLKPVLPINWEDILYISHPEWELVCFHMVVVQQAMKKSSLITANTKRQEGKFAYACRSRYHIFFSSSTKEVILWCPNSSKWK